VIRGEGEARLLHHVLELPTSAGSRTLNTAAGSGHGAAHAHRFPLLLVAGLRTAKALPERAVALIMRSNRLGLAGFTFVSLTAAYWMIPVALDQALLSGPAAAAKYTSFLAAGMLLPVSFPAAPLAMQAFFVGNWVWMTATVGLLYQNAPQQLCVNYLIGTQLSAGEGLVAAAVAIAGLWCVYAVPAYLDMTR
jgi:hypothetical protein